MFATPSFAEFNVILAMYSTSFANESLGDLWYWFSIIEKYSTSS